MCVDDPFHAHPIDLERERVTPRLAFKIARYGRAQGGFLAGLAQVFATLLWPLTMLLKLPFLGLLRFYKKLLSPMLPPACRFEPSCSVYAYQSIQQHGVIRGVMLTAYRLMRCQPFSRPGYDPVPELAAPKAAGPELAEAEGEEAASPSSIAPPS